MRNKMKLWEKVTGKHRQDGKLYGPGQPDGKLVPRPFHWEPLAGDPSWKPHAGKQEVVEEGPEFVKSLELVKRPAGFYNVVNPDTGEPLNDKALRYNDAVALIEDQGFMVTDDGSVVPSKEAEDDGDDGDVTLVCPVEDGTFGEDHEEYDDCSDCELAEQCEAFDPDEKDEGDKD